MIYDAFMYNGEADVLECRLTELAPVVDIFIIVEANRTHGGFRPKPFHYLDQQRRFMRWQNQIHYTMVTSLTEGDNPWVREHDQRNKILIGLYMAKPDDVVMISDVDEIPRRSSIHELLASGHGHTVFLQTLYAMTLNWRENAPWWGTVACRMRDLTTPQEARDNRMQAPTKLHDAGWHISWMGNDEARMTKYRNGCHYDDYPPVWNTTTGKFLDTQLRPSSYNSTYPIWVNEGHAPESWYHNGEVIS
jgi:beta-1,4-mannosyl-glycoprotein beta-1,4-N-acetylglucosaminyltransferase